MLVPLGLLLLLVHMLTLILPTLLFPPWIVLAARGLVSLILSPWLLPPWSFLASAIADLLRGGMWVLLSTHVVATSAAAGQPRRRPYVRTYVQLAGRRN